VKFWRAARVQGNASPTNGSRHGVVGHADLTVSSAPPSPFGFVYHEPADERDSTWSSCSFSGAPPTARTSPTSSNPSARRCGDDHMPANIA